MPVLLPLPSSRGQTPLPELAVVPVLSVSRLVSLRCSREGELYYGISGEI
jgi:hypothetical protein